MVRLGGAFVESGGGGGGVAGADHSLLANLAYAAAGHTGFAGTGVSNTFTKGQIIQVDTDAGIPLIVRPNSVTATGNMIEVLNSAGTVVSRFDATGQLGILTGATAIVGAFQVQDYIKLDPTNFNALYGYQAGDNDNGQYNLFLGTQAGFYNDTTGGGSNGTHNVYMGYRAGYGMSGPGSPATGYDNVALGYLAMNGVIGGRDDVAIGSNALLSVTNGYGHVALGRDAMKTQTGGRYNVAIGLNSLELSTLSLNNIAVGFNTLAKITTGQNNIAIGYSAGAGLTGAGHNDNVFIGYYAGNVRSGGDASVCIGYYAGAFQSGSVSNGLFIDAINRGTAAAELTNSLVVGQFNATPATQWLRCNALFGINKSPSTAMLDIISAAATNRCIRAKSAASSSVNIAEFDDSADNTKAWVNVRDNGNNAAGPSIGVDRNSNAGAEGPAAGTFELNEADGTSHFLWFDAYGRLRENSAAPTGSSGTPTVADTAGNLIARERLTAARTYYVRSDGSDSNDGLADTAGGAFLTIAKAISVYQALDCNGYDVTIYVRAATWTETGLTFSYRIGAGDLYFLGDEATPSNVVISVASGNSLTVSGHPIGSIVYIRGFKLASSAAHCIAVRGSQVYYKNEDFSTTTGSHLVANSSGIVRCDGNYSITGNAAYHLDSGPGGFHNVPLNTPTVTLTGTPAFTAYARAYITGSQQVNGFTFSGSATGARYDVWGNGVIYTAGGATYFPGNAAGSTATGGQYI